MKLPLQLISLLSVLGLSPLVAGSCCAPTLDADAPLPTTSVYLTEAQFTTDQEASFRLAELRGHPVALVMFFSSCTYACPATVADLAQIRERLPEEVRQETRIVMVSFDTVRDTAVVLHHFRESRGLDQNWILLRGTEDSVRELAAVLGVKFKRESDGSFAHSNLITILSVEGEVVHQRAGLTGGLDDASAALRSASSLSPL